MRFGVCADVAWAEEAARAGFAYFEYPLWKLEAMEEGELAGFLEQVARAGIAPEVGVNLLPGGHRLTGAAAEIPRALAYCQRAFPKAARCGMRTLVFGAQGARNLPDGDGDLQRAYDQLTEFLRGAGRIAQDCGLTIAVEGLSMGPKGANLLALLTDAVYVARRVDLASVRVIADYYHMKNNRESWETLGENARWLCHTHVSSLARRFPAINDPDDYAAWCAALKTAGYDGTMSVEAMPPACFPEAARDAVRTLAAAWEKE